MITQRLPAVPLITCDPYFSLWSPADRLTDKVTCHWTGDVKGCDGAIEIDGEKFRFMGDSNGLPVLEQKALEITATASKYYFEGKGVGVWVTFCTPLLLTDLELVSRPVSYITFEVTALDGKGHSAEISMEFDEGFCYDGTARKAMVGGCHVCSGFEAAWMGRKTQSPLSHSGDGVTIDWGYMYLAAKTGQVVSYEEGERSGLKALWKISLEGGGSETLTLAVAYDDISSIQYFDQPCKGYWARNGQSILEAIEIALKEYKSIASRCDVFDESLKSKAEAIGGEDYGFICAAAYRQSIGAHKLIADKEGNVVFISKECYSNGCAATVDVSYPSTPLYLLYQPELVKGMLRPVFKFAKMPVWKYDFAPHDVGRYPYVWGQVYGLNKGMEDGEVYPPFYQYPAGADIFQHRYQMPVEECGNMLIMTAAAGLADGDVEFLEENMELLEKWVAYLLEYGADPGDQLCTDDFAGHLAHNINLAAKAIMGIEAYSIILGFQGRENESEQYHQRAATMAADWEKRAFIGETSTLAFGDTDTFSLKYNIIWDKIFDSGLFQGSSYGREVNTYLNRMNDYGVPLDSRKDYTKSDWMMWVASFTEEVETFKKFAAPLKKFLNEAPMRTPFSDWYDTKTAEQIGFQNRTVQGGLFMPMLVNENKMKWQIM